MAEGDETVARVCGVPGCEVPSLVHYDGETLQAAQPFLPIVHGK